MLAKIFCQSQPVNPACEAGGGKIGASSLLTNAYFCFFDTAILTVYQFYTCVEPIHKGGSQ